MMRACLPAAGWVVDDDVSGYSPLAAAAAAPAAARHASRGQAGRASPAVHASICISDLSLPSQRSIDSSISIENRRQGRVVDDG